MVPCCVVMCYSTVNFMPVIGNTVCVYIGTVIRVSTDIATKTRYVIVSNLFAKMPLRRRKDYRIAFSLFEGQLIVI